MDVLNKDKVPVPAGYRESIVGAITVVLGFSLLFMRYWSLEAPGEWDALSFVAEVLLAVAIFLELYSLWRALSLEDDEASEYRKTLRWFIASVAVLIVSLLLAAEIAAEPRLPFLKGASSMTRKGLRGTSHPRAALEAAGVEFTIGDEPGVKLRKKGRAQANEKTGRKEEDDRSG